MQTDRQTDRQTHCQTGNEANIAGSIRETTALRRVPHCEGNHMRVGGVDGLGLAPLGSC